MPIRALQACKTIVASDSTTSKPPRTWTRFAGVERLSLSRCNAYRVDACHIKALQMLRSIRLGPHATDADLQALWPLKSTLQTVNLDNRGKLQSSPSHVRRNGGNDVAMVSCLRISDTGIASLSCLPQLTDINFSGCCHLTDASLRTIASNHPRLLSLGTAYCPSLTDAGIGHLLQSCTSLESVNFAGCSLLTEESLARLGGCTNLTNVKLSRCQLVTDAAIEAISRLPRLESLFIARCNLVTDAGLDALESATSLRILEMPGCSGVSDIGLQSLSALTKLCRLNIAAIVHVTDAGLDALSGPLSLTSVNLSSLPNITAAPLEGLTALTSCTLTRCPSVTTLEPLQMLTRLQSLEIGHPTLGMPGCIETLALLTGLVRLSVSSANRPPGSETELLHALSKLSLIEELSLPNVWIDPENFADAVRNWPLLKSLKIASKGLREATIAIVPQLPHLRKLQIASGRMMSESNMEGIAGICDLDDLAIHECAPAAVSGLGLSFLQSLPLTSLDLSNCRTLTDEMLAALGPVDTLRQLCLAGCISLRGTGLSSLSCAPHLKILSCRRTGFGNEAAEKLVSSMHRLRNLDLSECCYITNEAGECLSVLAGLTCLNLIGCASLQEVTIQLIISCMPGTEVLHSYAM